MKNLLLDLFRWRARLERDPLAVFLDYDGTLAAIAPTPQEARLAPSMRETLALLARVKGVNVGIISGRALKDLRRLVGVRGVAYVGSHGIELSSGGRKTERVPAGYLAALRLLRKRLSAEMAGIPGIILEDKPFSLAIHYRKVETIPEERIRRRVFDICRGAVSDGVVSVSSGKKVLEVMPPTAMDKGEAVRHLLDRWAFKRRLPIFIGDDLTDEPAFGALRACGLTVRVGDPGARTKAEYCLNGVEEVRMFLEILLYFRSVRMA